MPPRTSSTLVLATLVARAAACATRAAGGDGGAAAIVDAAIARAGGEGALSRARALTWEGDAVVHAGGRTIAIAGRWAVLPPDTAVVTTWPAAQGPAAARTMVVAAPRGWAVRGGAFTPLPAAVLANERDAFALYDLLRLVPLRTPGVRLARVPDDSLGRRGVRAQRPGRPDAELWVDRSGRLARVRLAVADAQTGRPVPWDVALEGEVAAAGGGVRWPRTLRIAQGGAPYFELTVRALRVDAGLRDTLLLGPGAGSR